MTAASAGPAQPAVDSHPRHEAGQRRARPPPSPVRRISERAACPRTTARMPVSPKPSRRQQHPGAPPTHGLPLVSARRRQERPRYGRRQAPAAAWGPAAGRQTSRRQLPDRTGRIGPRDPLVELAAAPAPLAVPGPLSTSTAPLTVGVRGEHRATRAAGPGLWRRCSGPAMAATAGHARMRHGAPAPVLVGVPP